MRNKDLIKVLKRFPLNAEIKIRTNNGSLNDTFEISATVNEEDEWNLIMAIKSPANEKKFE